MEALYERCCGIDIHKKVIVACLRVGKKEQILNFNTLTCDIKKLANWLLENECEKVAMESTGVYWKPVYNILELYGLDVIVVNAKHMKNVPGRKTDVKDASWIAQLLQNGLLKASFIPDREQRELRELVRYRKQRVEERSREINRLEKVLESANIKLSSFVSSIVGVSSLNLINKSLDDEISEENISTLIHHSMESKKDLLIKAMDGVFSDILKDLIRTIIKHINDMTNNIKQVEEIIDKYMDKYQDAIIKLNEIPGIGEHSAKVILSEIGLDMSRFPTAAQLASWAGLCPGNNESAGKRRSGKTTKANKYIKSIMIQSAQCSVNKKGTFFYAQYQRLVVKRGKNRAKVAVAHSMIIAIYHMLKNGTSFIDLGDSYYTKFNKESKIRYYYNKLKELGVPTPA